MLPTHQPDAEGFYFYRHSDSHDWSVMETFRRDAKLMCRNFTDDGNFPENYTGEWVGPLELPTLRAECAFCGDPAVKTEEWEESPTPVCADCSLS